MAFKVMVEEATEVGTEVVRVGATTPAVGVTPGLVATLAVLVPTILTAYTWNVYEVPFERPVTTIGEPVEVAVKLPGVEEAR